MDLRIIPNQLSGDIAAITSKSDAHRCLICAALCRGETEVLIKNTNRDISATAQCLRAMGAKIEELPNGVFKVSGILRAAPKPQIDCQESGSTLRFLLPVAAALGNGAHLLGCGRLPERPLSPLREEMQAHGCLFLGEKLPFELCGKLESGRFKLPGNVSSQYITGLLLALPLLEGDSEIALTSPLESAGYVDMTVRTLKQFGIEITVLPQNRGYGVSGGQNYISPQKITAEGDWSNAAFWLASGALGKAVSVSGLDTNSAQGDRAISSLLKRFGAKVNNDINGITVENAALHGIEIDAAAIPDLVPVLAVTACGALGETKIVNAARLRIKESDRLKTVSEMIRALGGSVIELPDSLVIRGNGRLLGGRINSHNDHRIAMAAAVASSICSREVIIENADAVTKSYPAFFEDFIKLGGRADVI